MKFKTALVLFALGAGSGMAQELIVNGNFENVAVDDYSAQLAIDPIFDSVPEWGPASVASGGSLEQGVQTVTGWTTTGYNFLFRPEDASVPAYIVGYDDDDQPIYGGGYGRNAFNESYAGFWSEANGGSGEFTASPAGGNFIALDAAFILTQNWNPWPDGYGTENLTQPLEQTIHGLVIGEEYELTFWWAAAQQYGFDGDTTEFLTVTFGEESYVTETIYLEEHTFSGWMQETVRFTATAASQTLSFLAGGGPDGLPPFALLDGVSMQAVPEPGSAALLALGVSGFLLLRSRRSARGKKG